MMKLKGKQKKRKTKIYCRIPYRKKVDIRGKKVDISYYLLQFNVILFEESFCYHRVIRKWNGSAGKLEVDENKRYKTAVEPKSDSSRRRRSTKIRDTCSLCLPMYPACSLQRRTLRQPVLRNLILYCTGFYIRSRFAATVVVGESVGGYMRGK